MASYILDNPIWNALSTKQKQIALASACGQAKRFAYSVGPLSGLVEQSRDAYTALEGIVDKGEPIVLFLDEPLNAPNNWEITVNEGLTQMVLEKPLSCVSTEKIVPLNDDDIPEMLALTKLTQPGPFRNRTIDYGGYIGIKANGKLQAMAGHRLHMTGFTEISAVCTHPDSQGKGYAKQLLTLTAQAILNRGETPFLHTWARNSHAIEVYKKLGFKQRKLLTVATIKLT